MAPIYCSIQNYLMQSKKNIVHLFIEKKLQYIDNILVTNLSDQGQYQRAIAHNNYRNYISQKGHLSTKGRGALCGK